MFHFTQELKNMVPGLFDTKGFSSASPFGNNGVLFRKILYLPIVFESVQSFLKIRRTFDIGIRIENDDLTIAEIADCALEKIRIEFSN